MRIKFFLLVLLIVEIFSGCTEKNDISNDFEKEKLNLQNISSLSKTDPNSDKKKKEREIIERCNGTKQCVCNSLQDIVSYSYKGEDFFCNRKKILKTAVPSLSSERGVKKLLPILEESHNYCKGEAQYNECFCKKSNFSGSVTIGNIKYLCR